MEVTQLEGWLLKRGEGYVDPDDNDGNNNATSPSNGKGGSESNQPSSSANANSHNTASQATGANGGSNNGANAAQNQAVGEDGKPLLAKKKKSIFGKEFQLPESAAQSVAETAEAAIALAKAKYNDIRAAGTAEKKRFFRLVSIELPKDASLNTTTNAANKPKGLLKYFSREKCDPSSLKGTIPLTDETEVFLLPNDTVIKLVTPGRTYFLRPEGDRSSALARATAARWVHAIDTEIRRLYVFSTTSAKKASAEVGRTGSSNGTGVTSQPSSPRKKFAKQLLKQESLVFNQEEEDPLPTDLESLLKDPKHRKEFHKFCENALGAESMDFMDALDVYDKLKDPAKKLEACDHIIKVFIEQDGEKQVNISSEQRHQIIKLYNKKGPKDPPPKGLFDEARFEVFKLLEKNFFKRFLKELEKKTGAFTALFGLFGLDGWNAVVSHFGTVMTDHERTLLGLKLRLQRAEAQQNAIEESLRESLIVSTTVASTTTAALRRTYASINMQIGALSLFSEELKEEVIKPMTELSLKVKTDLDAIVKSVAEPVGNLEFIRKLIAAANVRAKRAQEVVDSLAWDQATGVNPNATQSGASIAGSVESPQAVPKGGKRQSFGAAVKQNMQAAFKIAKDKLDANGQQPEVVEEVLSPEEELKAAKNEIVECEKAQETCEENMTKAFEAALDKLESLELYRLETTKKILRHAALAEHELFKTMKRVLEEMGNASRKIDAASDIKAISNALLTPNKPIMS